MVYYSILLLLCVFGFLDFKKQEHVFKRVKHIHIFIVSSLLLILLAAFRYNVGSNDYYVYLDYFHNIQRQKHIADMEIGYVLLNQICNFLFHSFNAVIFITGLLSIGFKTEFIRKYSPFPIISLLIYYSGTYIHTDFSGIRQALAIGILLLFSFKFLLDKKYIKFLISVIIASLFHVSSLIFLLGYLIVKVPDNKKVLISGFIISFLIGISDALRIITGWMVNLLNNQLLSIKYVMYFSSRTLSIDIGYAVNIIMVAILIYLLPKLDEKLRVMAKLYIAGIIIYNIFMWYPIAGRIVLSFSIFELILMPYIAFYIAENTNFIKIDDKIKKIVIYVFLCLYCALKLFLLFRGAYGMFNPYHTFFFK